MEDFDRYMNDCRIQWRRNHLENQVEETWTGRISRVHLPQTYLTESIQFQGFSPLPPYHKCQNYIPTAISFVKFGLFLKTKQL